MKPSSFNSVARQGRLRSEVDGEAEIDLLESPLLGGVDRTSDILISMVEEENTLLDASNSDLLSKADQLDLRIGSLSKQIDGTQHQLTLS